MTPLDNFKAVCQKHFIIRDMDYIEIVFGTIFANKLDSKPVWIYIVGAPSSGKTVILQTIQGPDIAQESKITAKSLISGYYDPRVPKDQQEEPSLLPRWDGKTVIIKDFTSMINSKRESLMEIIGELRDAYDGYSTKSFGTGETKTFQSKFGIIAAVTNIIDKHRGMLAELGERFLTYRSPDISYEEASQRCWKVSGIKEVSKQETELRDAAAKVLKQKMYKVILPDTFRKKVIQTAQYVAVGRCEVSRDPRTKEPEIPVPEIATRLTRQLCDLAIGIAIVQHKTYITKRVEKMVLKTALDTITLKRLRTIKVLYDAFPKPITTREVVDKMRYSETIIRQWLEDLHLLDLISRDETFGSTNYKIGKKVIWKLKHKALLHRIWS